MKTNRIFQLLFLLFITSPAWAQTTYGWGHATDGSSGEYGEHVAVDSLGNTFLVGSFSGNFYATIAGAVDTLKNVDASFSTPDIYIEKLDLKGNTIWAKSIGVTDGMKVDDVTFHGPSDQLYLCGYFQGTVDFDPGTGIQNFTARGFYDAFLLRLDGFGNFVDVTVFSGIGSDYIKSVDVGVNGEIYLAGVFSDSADVDPGSGTSYYNGGTGRMSIVELAPTLNLGWIKTYDSSNLYINHLKVMNDSISILANHNDTMNMALGPIPTYSIAPPHSYSIIAATYSTGGDLGWWKRLDLLGNTALQSSSVTSPFYAFEVAPDNHIYIGGSFGGTMAVDSSTTFSSPLAYKAFLVKLSRGGHVVWGHSFGGQKGPNGYAQDNIRALGITETGDVYLAGSMTGSEDLNPDPNIEDTIPGTYNQNFYVAHWDEDGHFVAADNSLSSMKSYVNDGILDPYDQFLFCGSFNGNLELDFTYGGDTAKAFSLNGYAVKLSCNRFAQDTLFGIDSLVHNGITYYQSDIQIQDTLLAYNGCDSIIRWTTSIDSTITFGIDAVSPRMTLYPNPIRSGQKLRVEPVGSYEFFLYSPTGEIIQHGRCDGTLEIKDVRAGFYVVELVTENQHQAVTLVVLE
ncbi:MAG: hypothetical protein RL754_377 [Bacteroidota bacterium]|jgi:hypothetical protein